MPGKPRAGRVAPRWDLTPMQLYQLCTGSCFFPDAALSAADLPPAWRSVRALLLDLYAQHCPGNRPWCWWLMEAPSPRQCLHGAHACPQRDAVLREQKQGQLYYGRPGSYCCFGCWEEQYESQARYLRRLGLLLQGETAVPPDLTACDAWAARQYADDHPHPWATGEALTWCAAVLGAGAG